MVYLTPDEIEKRIEYQQTDYFEDGTGYADDWEELLESLEKETRAYIESYMGDETFSYETGTTLEVTPPDNSTIQLSYPVDSIDKVEVKKTRDGDWEELDSDRYYHTDHSLILHERPSNAKYRGRLRRRRNPISRFTERATWRDLYYNIKVTYDRGFENIPENVKGIQISMINNLLRNLRLEQSIGAIEADAIGTYVDAGSVMTEDIEKRLDEITGFGRATVVI